MDSQADFLRAYDAYADAIFRHCYFRVYDRERARELMQETFTRTWRYLSDGGQIDHLRAFLYRTARNLVVDEQRRRTSVSLDALLEQGIDPAPVSGKLLEVAADAHRLLEVIHQLPVEYKEVLLLRYVEGLAPREIARLTGESANVISVRIYRARRQLRQHFPAV